MVDVEDDEADSNEIHAYADNLERTGQFAGPVAGAGLTQLLLAVGGFPALAALAGAVASPVVSSAARAIAERHRKKLQLAAEIACSEGRCTFDEIVSSTVDNDSKIELLRQALDGAAVADDLRKVRALGRALAQGVLQADAAKVQEMARIVEALRALDGADARLLAHMIESEQVSFNAGDSGDPAGTLHRDLPELSAVMDSLVARLSTHGLIKSTTSGGGGGGVLAAPVRVLWRVTSFGELCMSRWLSESPAGP